MAIQPISLEIRCTYCQNRLIGKIVTCELKNPENYLEGLWRVVHSQLRHNFVCRFLRMSGECAQNLQTLHKYTTDDNHANQNHRRGRDQSRETPKHTQLSCRRQESPTSMDYRSGERARITMRPPSKYARSQGTPSPQISVTFRTL